MNEPRWIIHLPTTLTSLDAAIELANALRTSLAHLSVIEFGETTLASADRRFLRTRVWCDASIDGPGGDSDARRCQRPDGHDGPCGAGEEPQHRPASGTPPRSANRKDTSEVFDQNGTALVRRHVGRWFAQLRTRAGFSQDAAAVALQRGPATIWRIEAGDHRVRFRDADVTAMCDLYAATPQVRDRLQGLTRAVMQTRTSPEWWHQYSDDLPYEAGFYPSLERHAAVIHRYDQETIPELLQTTSYAEIVLGFPTGHLSQEEIGRRLDSQRQRQTLLTRAGGPLLRVIVNESAIHRTVGGPETMADQLAHLLAVADQPTVSVRVLPFTSGAHAGMTNAFTLLRFHPSSLAPNDPSGVVYLDALTGALYLDRSAHIAAYQRVWRELESQAHDERTTKELIVEAVRRHTDQSTPQPQQPASADPDSTSASGRRSKALRLGWPRRNAP